MQPFKGHRRHARTRDRGAVPAEREPTACPATLASREWRPAHEATSVGPLEVIRSPRRHELQRLGSSGEHPRRPGVDDQLEAGRLQHRQVGGPGARKDACHVEPCSRRAPNVGCHSSSARRCGELTPLEDGRQRMARRQRHELFAPTVEERVVAQHQRADPLAARRRRRRRLRARWRREGTAAAPGQPRRRHGVRLRWLEAAHSRVDERRHRRCRGTISCSSCSRLPLSELVSM